LWPRKKVSPRTFVSCSHEQSSPLSNAAAARASRMTGNLRPLASGYPRPTPSVWPGGSRPRSAARRHECACQRQRHQFGVDLPSSSTTSHRRAGRCGADLDWRSQPGVSARHVANGSVNSSGGSRCPDYLRLPLVGEGVLLGGEVKRARERARPAEAVVVDEDRCVVMASAALHRASPSLRETNWWGRQHSIAALPGESQCRPVANTGAGLSWPGSLLGSTVRRERPRRAPRTRRPAPSRAPRATRSGSSERSSRTC
jgi:hypothetical protein